jgi:hypothetical protein
MSTIARAAGSSRSLLFGALLGICASGCIDGILIDEQRQASSALDAEAAVDEDGAASEQDGEGPQDPSPTHDAGAPGEDTDAGKPPPPPLDAGRDAGRDAGGTPSDAGTSQDAGCKSGLCDAGPVVLGPCGTCDVTTTLVQPVGFTDGVSCDNGAPKLCWSNPAGPCTVQCPNTPTCTKDDLGACGPDHYCYFPRSDCGATSAGFCAPAPRECMPNVTSRVCGCDGVIYQNPCFAAQAGSGAYLGSPENFCN